MPKKGNFLQNIFFSKVNIFLSGQLIFQPVSETHEAELLQCFYRQRNNVNKPAEIISVILNRTFDHISSFVGDAPQRFNDILTALVIAKRAYT